MVHEIWRGLDDLQAAPQGLSNDMVRQGLAMTVMPRVDTRCCSIPHVLVYQLTASESASDMQAGLYAMKHESKLATAPHTESLHTHTN